MVELFSREKMRTLKYSPVGRKYYDPHMPVIILQHTLEVWPSYINTIQNFV